MVHMTESQTVGIGLVPVSVNRPWCMHENSPVTEKRALQWPERSLLRCDGSVGKCLIGYKAG